MGDENLLTFSVSSPGKIILFGEHAVVYGKSAIAASIGLRTTGTLAELYSQEEFIELDFPCIDLKQKFYIKNIKDALLSDGIPLLNYESSSHILENPDVIDYDLFYSKIVKFINSSLTLNSKVQENAVVSFLYLLSGIVLAIEAIDLKSFKVSVTSELTVGAGTGSSASFAVSLAGIFTYYISQKKKGLFKADSLGKEFSSEQKKIICHWAYISEKVMHGKPSGLDNTVCTYGGLVKFAKNITGIGLSVEQLSKPKHFRVLLIDTGVTRVTSQMVRQVAALKEKYSVITDLVLEAINKVSESAANILVQLSNYSGKHEANAEDLELQKNLQDLIVFNQGLLMSVGVSHPSIDEIIATVGSYNVHAKLTGAGGGGFVFVFLPPDFCNIKSRELLSELCRKGFKCYVTDLGGEGVMLD